jgi:hypothetical protein
MSNLQLKNARIIIAILAISATMASVGVSAAPSKKAKVTCPWNATVFNTATAPRAPVVVMALSPRMVYSFLEWRHMRALAVKDGFCVVAARDPRVPESEWKLAVNSIGLGELLAAPTLTDLGLETALFFNHAPTSQVWFKGRAHPWTILGVMNDQAWRQSLQSRLSDLKKWEQSG